MPQSLRPQSGSRRLDSGTRTSRTVSPSSSLAIPEDFLERFAWTRLVIVCRAEDDLDLPFYSGSAFRGALGHALAEVDRIAFDRVFEGNTGRPPVNARYGTTPPYTIAPPVDCFIARGVRFELGVTLFGNAIAHTPAVIEAVALCGRNGVGPGRGRFAALAVAGEDGEPGEPVFACDMAGPWPGGALGLTLLSPLHIKTDGEENRAPSFEVLVRAILRRLTVLASSACELRLDMDFKAVCAAARDVRLVRHSFQEVAWRRASMRQDHVILQEGLIGRALYEGDLSVFSPLLALAELMHIGKGTSFGLGRIRCESLGLDTSSDNSIPVQESSE